MRPGAWVAEVTGLFDLAGWPPGMRLMVRRERPHPGAQLRITDCDGHPITVRHQHHPRTTGRPGTSAPPPGPRRGPPPLRERHRAGQPAAARLRPEPDLVRHRRARRRPARLDADPRPGRSRCPPVGTETAAPATVLHPGPPRPHRPPPAAAPGRRRTVHHARPAGTRRPRTVDRPTAGRQRLSRAGPVPTTRGTGRPVEPAPTRATSGKPSHPDASLTPTRDKNPGDRPHDHDRERSGLMQHEVV